jgi:glycosyltransferase involved in cell wall biosynthesis
VRLLLLLYEYDPRVQGGMGGYRHAVELGEQWTRLGHDVTIVRPRLAAPAERAAVRVVESPFTAAAPLRAASAYAGLCATALAEGRRARPDVVYAREMAGPVPLVVARALGAALVLEVNGDSYRHRRERLGEARWRTGLLHRLQRLSFRRADRIVAVTAGLRAMLLARFALGPARVVVVENGANLDRLAPGDAVAARRALGLAERAPTVGFVGTFFPYQGLPTLIDAAPSILATHPDARFLVVGDGPAREAWQARARSAGVGAAFVFPGQVPHTEVAAWINAMDVCVAPFVADRGEGSPLKLFDYFACARPVVASDIPAVRHLVDVTGACVAVPPDQPAPLASAVARLLGDAGARARLGAAGRAWVVRDHGWDAVAARVLQVCEAARAERRSPRR